MEKAILKGMLYIPLSMIRDIKSIKEELTVIVNNDVANSFIQSDEYTDADSNDKFAQRVKGYDVSMPGYLGVPRFWGKKHFPDLKVISNTTTRSYDKPCFPNNIVPRDKEQKQFFSDLLKAAQESSVNDIIANARTGTGKTIADLWLTAKLNMPTLVVVHTNVLRRQWKDRITSVFGEKWADKYLGHVQQDICDYKDRRIVIGLLPSISRRDYGKGFYNYFSKITFDEVHKASAPLMSESLKKFPAAVRIGYTATNRSDALRKICYFHLGPPKVISKQEVMRPAIYIHKYTGNHSLVDYNQGTLINSLIKLENRNTLICDIIENGYCRDRNILVLSDRVLQLQYIEKVLIDRYKIPFTNIGVYVGAKYTGHKKKVNGRFQFEKVKVSESELKLIAQTKSIILATYGIFDTGTDIDRLDMGVEATPRRNVVQALGRILRIMPGKRRPEWHSIMDDITYIPVNRFESRKTYRELINWTTYRYNSYNHQRGTILEAHL